MFTTERKALLGIEKIKSIPFTSTFGSRDVLAGVGSNDGGGRYLDAMPLRVFSGKDGRIHDTAHRFDVLFEVELAHAQCGAVRVEAVMQGITDQIGDGLMRADILDEQRGGNAVGKLAVIHPARRVPQGELGRSLILGQAALEIGDELFSFSRGELRLLFRWHLAGSQ